MHRKTSEFMKKLRERHAKLEANASDRLKAIRDQSQQPTADQGDTSAQQTKSEIWLDDDNVSENSVGIERSSILGLVRGDVKAKSSTNRSKRSKRSR